MSQRKTSRQSPLLKGGGSDAVADGGLQKELDETLKKFEINQTLYKIIKN